MRSYLLYYLAWFVLSSAMRQPILLVGIVLFFLLRRYIPDPGALFRALARTRALERQVEVNPANVTARRDLARLALDLRRPGRAVALLEAAGPRAKEDAELNFLLGLALHRKGRHEDALGPLVRSVEERAIRYGEPYYVAGEALLALGRVEEALDAFERYADINHSDVKVHVALAKAHAMAKDRAEVRKSLDRARDTFRQIPASMRRRALGALVEAYVLRARLLGDVSAIVTVALVATGIALGGAWLAPRLVAFVSGASGGCSPLGAVGAPYGAYGAYGAYGDLDPEHRELLEAFERCGAESTAPFDGRYVEASPRPAPELDAPGITEEQRRTLREYHDDQYRDLVVQGGRIRMGTLLRRELCLTRVHARSDASIHAQAVFHEDVHDPGDASLVDVRMDRAGENLRLAIVYDPASEPETVELRPVR